MSGIKFYITIGLVLTILMPLVVSMPYKKQAFAATAGSEKMNVDLVVDTKTLKFQDTNGKSLI
jgi:hypothetical protein